MTSGRRRAELRLDPGQRRGDHRLRERVGERAGDEDRQRHVVVLARVGVGGGAHSSSISSAIRAEQVGGLLALVCRERAEDLVPLRREARTACARRARAAIGSARRRSRADRRRRATRATMPSRSSESTIRLAVGAATPAASASSPIRAPAAAGERPSRWTCGRVSSLPCWRAARPFARRTRREEAVPRRVELSEPGRARRLSRSRHPRQLLAS